MNAYLAIILTSLAASWFLCVLSNILNARHMRPAPPAEFADVFDSGRYAKSQAYNKATMRFTAITETCGTALSFAVILAGGFNWLDLAVRSFDLSPVPTGLLFFAGISLASGLFNLPFEIYQTFVLENRFGFNTTTIRTFIADRLKSLILTGLLGGLLLAGILYFFEKTGDGAWLWCWGLAVAFTLTLTYVAPTWILPIFNKFTPLEEGKLRTELEAFARKANFTLSGIFVMDGSKRSTKGNAFFTGFGNRKRIALFDTLIEKQTKEEIVAVLAHEVGHSKLGHIKKRLLVGILKTGVVFYLMSLFLKTPELFAAFGMEHISTYAGLIFFVLLYSPVSMALSIVSNAISRRHEFEADKYAALTTEQPEAMISALKKLSASNLSNLTPHPLKVWLEYSHPPVLERIHALQGKTK